MVKFTKMMTLMMAMMTPYVYAGFGDDDDDDSGSGKGGKGRRALKEDPFEMMADSCNDVVYDISVLVVKETGHLQGYAEPSKTRNAQAVPKACKPVVGHIADDKMTGEHYKLVHVVRKQIEERFWNTRVSHYVGSRTLGQIADAVNQVELYGNSYSNWMVDVNCGTFILELGRILEIPVDWETVNFVTDNMVSTKFINSFTTSSNYNTLAVSDWFGGRKLAEAVGVDAKSMVRRLFDYMLHEQYPEQLIKLD